MLKQSYSLFLFQPLHLMLEFTLLRTGWNMTWMLLNYLNQYFYHKAFSWLSSIFTVCTVFLLGPKGGEAHQRRWPEAGTHMWNPEEVWRTDHKGSVSLPDAHKTRLWLLCFSSRLATLIVKMQYVACSRASWLLHWSPLGIRILKYIVDVIC